MTYVIRDDTFVLAKSTHMRAAPMASASSRSSWSPNLWDTIRSPSQGSGQAEQAETPQGEEVWGSPTQEPLAYPAHASHLGLLDHAIGRHSWVSQG